LTDGGDRACAVPRLPRTRTSSIAACTSASVIQVGLGGESGVKLSPERLSLIESTPYLRNMRTAFLISSAELTLTPKLNSGNGRCGRVSSPRPPGTVISWLAAR
jgi:hypothetical protein